MSRYKVTVVFTVDEEDEDMAEMEVSTLLEDAVTVSGTSVIVDYGVKRVEEVEYEEDEEI